MRTTNPKILVLGATGMLGNMTYAYLSKKYRNIYGTSRNADSQFMQLDAQRPIEELREIFIKIGPEYVVNCIGILRNENKNDLKNINNNFPKILSEISKDQHFKIINISTDAVFGNLQGEVNEDSIPKPDDEYGKSKLAGEQKANALNIRTSILGFDPLEHKGLLELLLANGNSNILGFTNQKWSGATTLQLVKFIENLIYNNKLSDIIKKTNIIHFAPIESTNKYNIIETASNLLKLRKPKAGLGSEINRTLISRYIDKEELEHYCKNLKKALEELIKFNQDYQNTYEKK